MSEETTNAAEAAEPKKAKKLSKGIEGTTVTITVLGFEPMKFDFATLPADIQAKLGPFGLGHKLGDAAAGREGTDAVEAINKVMEGLVKGDWSVRAPAAPKITMASIRENLDKLSPKEQEAAKKLLASIGMAV